MKTYNFSICKYHVTITIEKKPYKSVKEKSSEEKGCPPDYNSGFCADYDVDCDACWEEYTSMTNEKPVEEIKMEEPERLCLMEAAERYIDSKRGEFKTSTLKGYENIIYHHFNIDFWLILLDKLTEEHLQEAFDAEIAKGLSVKTLKGYRTFILKVLAEYRPDFHPNIRVTKESVNETPKT